MQRYAALYGIPWQVLAGLLQSEIQLDTNWKDKVENWVIRQLYIGAYFESQTPLLPIIPSTNPYVPEKPYTVLLELLLTLRPNPGPGVGNVHLETARRVSEYFTQRYPEHPEMQLGIEGLSRADLAFRLTEEDFNVKVVAAYTRMLADYRFGQEEEPLLEPHADLSQWTLEDALAVWYGYRSGVEKVSPPAQRYGFKIENFQRRDLGVEELLQVASGGLKEESILGAIPYFQCYFERCE